MKKRAISIALLLFACMILTGGYFLTAQQRDLSSKIVRLHVVANSDTDADQAVKLKVRDAVLETTGRILSGQPEDPKQALADNLTQIQQAANRCLLEHGSSDQAVVTMGRELFPTREYETFSLPAGTYTALRVTIGQGQGHNWWCVVFPSICMTASTNEFEKAAQTAGLTNKEIGLITEENDGYVLKFKTLELIQKLRNYLSK